ncbi:nuclear transport factor 2 family protein [Gordonia rubripertincta]|uniref:Nuclear transport factor 2 family protein n=1 Tax=Gordonia rubripertincta TaxID=36822 RepID=A0ABT4MWM3_GORRU|nr:nuclear transport factor 2 family protein [Gordonia rubripertincta]MCZ4551415.1 nuclear transport factor 2 family protein [Gordonia rubripertincta]
MTRHSISNAPAMTSALSLPPAAVGPIQTLPALMRRYTHAYTNCHDFDECRRLMVEDYTLRMGDNILKGREDEYIPATAKQFLQFPGLGISVHDVVLGTNRVAMHFSEFGRSALTGCQSVWGGISMYRWNGEKLTECRVEQDYYARREQSRSGIPDLIEAPAFDPWTVEPRDPDPGTEQLVRDWIHAGGLFDSAIGSFDNEATSLPRRPLMSERTVTVLDLFTAGPRAAFHAVVHGKYAGGLGSLDSFRGKPTALYIAGICTVAGETVTVRAVSDRLIVERRLLHGW